MADIVAVQLVSIGLHVNDGSNEDEELSRFILEINLMSP